MLTQIKKIATLAALSLGFIAFTTSPAAAQTRAFRVSNESSYAIEHIYVSPANYSRWGYDRLGDDVLQPGYQFTLFVVPAFYDVKLIDQDGDSCVINGVDFRDGERWTLTNRVLVTCELATAF